MSLSDEVYIPTAWLQADVYTLEVKRNRAQELAADAADEGLSLACRYDFLLQFLWLDQRIKVLKTRALLLEEGANDYD